VTVATYLPRSAWGARPRNGGGRSLSTARVEGEALHWPGMSSRIDATGDAGARRVASALRGWQDYHMDVRGWSDIAYMVAIDQAGRAWTLRGLNVQSGANGNEDVNERFGAFLLVLGPGEEPTAAMKATVRAVIMDFRALFPRAAPKPKGHRDVRPEGTDCPGDRAYAAIQRGDFTPGIKTEDDDVAEITPAQMSELGRAFAAAADAAARKWALWTVLYGLETEDDLEAAREEWKQAYDAARAAGKTEEQAEAAGAAAAERSLRSLREAIKASQG
jgi:hypothetical protein